MSCIVAAESYLSDGFSTLFDIGWEEEAAVTLSEDTLAVFVLGVVFFDALL